mgnify:CR=1 FL=1
MQHPKNWQPLERRTYKYKNVPVAFFCPLCRTERAITLVPRLTKVNYLQVVLISLALIASLYPWMQLKSAFVFFIVWASFEYAKRLQFKKQVPCPHCGFDATSYKRNVKVAREEVKAFWDSKNNQAQPTNS